MLGVIFEQLPLFTMVVYPLAEADGTSKFARVIVIFFTGAVEEYTVRLETVLSMEEILKRGI